MRYFAACMTMVALGATGAMADDTRTARGEILSAFFGLDNSRMLRVRASWACRKFTGSDGMPVVLSEEIDDETLDTDDFRITTDSGKTGRVDCVTLQPAEEQGEKRTVLLVGQYGSAEDQPVQVEVVGDLLSLDGSVNFKGTQSTVIPLESGPTIILAEIVSQDDWSLGGRGDCPRDGIETVVRATWTGGITKPGGAEIDDKERQLYRVTVRQPDGTTMTVTPQAVGDLNDNDNNHDLCLGVAGEPVTISFPAGAVTDPNEDLNPDTEATVSLAAVQN